MNQMTLEEYNQRMQEYEDKLNSFTWYEQDEYEKFYEEMSKFQENYMKNVLDEYKKTIDCDARKYVYDLIRYAVEWSDSGSAILTVETEEIANEVNDYLCDIADYLLYWEIYEWEGKWEVDCLFGGFYVPYWDGWGE